MNKLIKEKKKFKIKGLMGNDTTVIVDRIKDKYGFIPKSVWDITRNKELSHLCDPNYLMAQSTDADQKTRAENHRDKHKQKDIPLPEFLPDMVKRCLQIYTKEGDHVLDPFCHSGIVPLLAAYFGRKGTGIDVVPEYIKYCNDRKKELTNLGKIWAKNMNFQCSDMRKILHYAEPMVDYILTSPPYFNTRIYKNIDGQLASIDNYNLFKVKLDMIFRTLYKILNIGGYISFVVSDFRLNGKFYPFHRDISNIAESVGLKPHDMIIHVLRTPFLMGMAKAIEDEKRMIKYHEYILTFKKVD
jgi:DNA modification methylase